MRRALFCLALAGCATGPVETPEQQAARIEAYYRPECLADRHTPGSEAYVGCIVAKYRRDEAQRRANAAALLSGQRPIPANVQPLPSAAPVNTTIKPPLNCTTTYVGSVARTTCQ